MSQEEKICTECGDSKPLKEFPFLNHRSDYGPRCIVCKNLNQVKRNKARKEKDPEAHKRKMKCNSLKKHYGITLEDYEELLDEQDNRCTICDIHEDELTKSLVVDHDHKTGKVRGLLCLKCNTILGQADDNIGILMNAIKYLKSC